MESNNVLPLPRDEDPLGYGGDRYDIHRFYCGAKAPLLSHHIGADQGYSVYINRSTEEIHEVSIRGFALDRKESCAVQGKGDQC